MSTTSYFISKFLEHCKTVGTTPYFVALESGIEPSLMSAIVNGRRSPKPRTWHELLKKIAACPMLQIDLATLVYWKAVDDYGVDLENPPLPLAQVTPMSSQGQGRLLKSLGFVAAGTLTHAVTHQHPDDAPVFELADLPAELDGTLYVLTIQGNSMAPRFEAGGLLVVQPTHTLEPSKYYVFETDDTHRTFKVLTLDVDKQQLTPLNPDYEPIPLAGLNCQRLYTVLEYRLRFY
jgi:SOS-response transcriptional repressor LexA